ncbi:MAG: hypothetical protein J3Q66DRAFT_391811 [Benniella sp.]|nr:MAG: hypothetical protein J3Q66DRAFT_391811 [Benniella sp.]
MSKHPRSDSEERAFLTRTLACIVFETKASVKETDAVSYLQQLGTSSELSYEAFSSFIRTRHPLTPTHNLTFMWNRLKSFFDGSRIEEYDMFALASMDALQLVTAFKDAPCVTEKEEEKKVSVTAAENERREEKEKKEGGSDTKEDPESTSSLSSLPGAVARSSRSSRSNSSKKTSTSMSNSSLKLEAVNNMRTEYLANLADFQGQQWLLPSGATLNGLLRPYLVNLSGESVLHSWIIDNVETVVALADDPKDKEQLRHVLASVEDQDKWTLPGDEQSFVDLYAEAPDKVELLISKGYAGMMDLAQGGVPSNSFCRLVHLLIDSLHMMYARNSYQLPKNSEGWYRENPRAILNHIFNDPPVIKYEPGEVHCQASAHRKNKNHRSTQIRQQCGRKADGIMKCADLPYELVVIEVAKLENGPNGTKALTDTVKLAKMMKDLFDDVRENCQSDDFQDHLVTYGIRISAGTATFYSLRFRRGGFFQLSCDGSTSFPEVWRADGSNTRALLTVVVLLLAFQHQVKDMARKIDGWTTSTNKLVHKPTAGSLEDRNWPRTLKAPTSSPCLSPTAPTAQVPELDIDAAV